MVLASVASLHAARVVCIRTYRSLIFVLLLCFSLSSICELNLEAELFTLQDSNSKLVAALHEANANVEQWKKQLAAYQEETERLREQVSRRVRASLMSACILLQITLH